ncbi:MAG: diacylglycerol kinase family protein [Thermoflexales bacterium]|nr:diacylglycerol kinase family protein [Thermoflexales bacterium]MCS7324666.1 diacylglycerol kinase family protein [Thermoflexales bacterium]MCX7939875.1 diacylglycerol kinase family protein [Thermoflexales bacterium]MDW8053177.1 diacylglycerol kinase family protein [Anaerolineae bacterium]MDW8291828.1 diacylglycerol kinase family protein [Anaerolineae bacterium]
MRAPNVWASFRFAFAGIAHAWRTQRNFRIHVAVTAAVLAAGAWLELSTDQWALLALTIGVVLQAELLNTALEAVVDHVAPEFHALAKAAKDCAAGAVFLSAGVAVMVGLLVLGPRLLARLGFS